MYGQCSTICARAMTIRLRTILGIVLIVAFVIGGTGFTFLSVRNQQMSLSDVEFLVADTVANRSIIARQRRPGYRLGRCSGAAVSLRHPGATRAQDGLDDGFKDAQRFADKFENDFGAAAGVAAGAAQTGNCHRLLSELNGRRLLPTHDLAVGWRKPISTAGRAAAMT